MNYFVNLNVFSNIQLQWLFLDLLSGSSHTHTNSIEAFQYSAEKISLTTKYLFSFFATDTVDDMCPNGHQQFFDVNIDRSTHRRCSMKKMFIKISQSSQEKHPRLLFHWKHSASNIYILRERRQNFLLFLILSVSSIY